MKLLQCICNFLERLHTHTDMQTVIHAAQSFIEISSWAYRWAAQAKTQQPSNLPAPREETGNDIRRAHVDVQMCMSFSVNTIERMQSNHVRWIWIMTPLNAAARDTSPFQIHIPVKDLSKLGEQMFQNAPPLALASPLLQNRPRQYWRSPTGQLYHRLYSRLRRFESLACCRWRWQRCRNIIMKTCCKVPGLLRFIPLRCQPCFCAHYVSAALL